MNFRNRYKIIILNLFLERQVNPPPERKRKRLQTTEVKDTPAKNQTYTRSQRVKARIRRSRTQSKSGISVVAESPERKTKFTGANPNLNFNTDQFKPTKTLQKLISGKFVKQLKMLINTGYH